MHKITFYPLGNADCCKIDLSNGKILLFDYANTQVKDDDDRRIDLENALHKELEAAKKDTFDIVAFTHADEDHIKGFSDFFYLDHAKKYQDNNRIHINELWVPAAIIIEDGVEAEAKILRAEARYRFKKGYGIRVFSRPDRLKEWLANEGANLKDRLDFIVDAGKLVPSLTLSEDGVEFFVHSPFAEHVDNGLEDRNEASLILHTTFIVDDEKTRLFLIGDTTHEILTDIVKITKNKKRADRLIWDIYDIPHHCSYLALNNKENKGKDKTEPTPEIRWLLEQGALKGKLISCSDPVPSEDTDQPPHKQAANLYKEIATKISGEFKVTMEHKTITNPEPIVIEIDKSGAKIKKSIVGGGSAAVISQSPRAGLKYGE